MKIDYAPSRVLSDTQELFRFHSQYIAPLGGGKKTVELSPDAVTIRADSSGLLTFTARFLEIAIGRLEELTLEVVERPVRGRPYGDLERGSPVFTIRRVSAPLDMPRGFSYEPPAFKKQVAYSTDNLSDLVLEIREYEPTLFHVILLANADSLVQLAKGLIYLSQSQAPVGTAVTYKSRSGSRSNNRPLRIEKIS